MDTTDLKARPVMAPSLEAFATLNWDDGVNLSTLAPYDQVLLETQNSTYEIVVTDPGTGAAMVRGGSFFPEFAAAYVAGSSLGGSFLKLRSVCVGLQLELAADGVPIVTTPVRRVAVRPAAYSRLM